MSGLELIPIVTGIICAIGATRGMISGKRKDRDRAGREHRSDRDYRDGRSSRRSRARGRSNDRSSRSISLSRDTLHSITFRYKSHSQRRWSNSSSERRRSKTPHTRRSTPNRRSSHARRYRSSSHDGKRRDRRSRNRLRGDARASRLIMVSPDEEVPRLDFCNGRVDRIRVGPPDDAHVRYVYICNCCSLEVVKDRITSWHQFLPSDRGKVKLHRNFILRSHEARDGKFGCMLCPRWTTGYKSLVFHLEKHRYADLENVVPEEEWMGSED